MQEYVGKDVQLIYNDSKRNVTIRIVRVLVVENIFKVSIKSEEQVKK